MSRRSTRVAKRPLLLDPSTTDTEHKVTGKTKTKRRRKDARISDDSDASNKKRHTTAAHVQAGTSVPWSEQRTWLVTGASKGIGVSLI